MFILYVMVICVYSLALSVLSTMFSICSISRNSVLYIGAIPVICFEWYLFFLSGGKTDAFGPGSLKTLEMLEQVGWGKGAARLPLNMSEVMMHRRSDERPGE